MENAYKINKLIKGPNYSTPAQLQFPVCGGEEVKDLKAGFIRGAGHFQLALVELRPEAMPFLITFFPLGAISLTVLSEEGNKFVWHTKESETCSLQAILYCKG